MCVFMCVHLCMYVHACTHVCCVPVSMCVCCTHITANPWKSEDSLQSHLSPYTMWVPRDPAGSSGLAASALIAEPQAEPGPHESPPGHWSNPRTHLNVTGSISSRLLGNGDLRVEG